MSSVRTQSKLVQAIAVQGHLYFSRVLQWSPERSSGEMLLVLNLSVGANLN